MKKILFIFLLLPFTYCGAKKSSFSSKKELIANLQSDCPEDGTCTLEVLRNKSLEVKTDEFGSNYYELIDSETTSVIYYKYNRQAKGNLQDGNYTEEVLFEISNAFDQYSYANEELQKVKMLFGRLCYCKGQAGYFKVNEGTLSLKKMDEKIELNLNFKINQVPQIITKVNAVIQ
jgi:hypothetical protein